MSFMSEDLLAAIEKNQNITLEGVTPDVLSDYVISQLRDTYVKPRRIDGRPLLSKDEFEKEYKAPIGLFNLGNNSLYIREEAKEEDEEEIEIKNNVQYVDGKMVFTEEEQKVDAAEEEYLFNVSVKSDLPYQIYMKIREFGRLTVEELYEMYRAIEKPLFVIIVNDMINKRYLKKIKEVDKDMVFKDIKGCKSPQEYMNSCIVETEIESLEVVSESERRQVLNGK